MKHIPIFHNLSLSFSKAFLFLSVSLITCNSSFAQIDQPIKSATVLNERARLGDKYEKYFKAFEEYIHNQRGDLNAESTNTVYTIPVIFHIIHNNDNVGSGDNIGKQYIDAQLEQLNNDFRRIMGTSGFGAGIDTRIEFCAATVNPNGNTLAEPGIDRINRNSKGWTAPPYGNQGASCSMPSFSYVDNTIKPQSIWNPEKYCNIWVMDLVCGVSGYAQFPEASNLPGIGLGNGGANTDGVVIVPGAVGSTDLPASSSIAIPFHDKGRRLTHELGHWLGLRNIWGDGNCSVDDFCNDTPNTNGPTSGCPNNKDTCPEPGDDQIENYMDLSDDSCMNMFTADQKTRMDIVMGRTANGSPRRAILLNSTVCGNNTPNPVYNLIVDDNSETVISPNDAIYDFEITFIDGYTGSITMSVLGLPTGASASFSTNPITAPDIYTLTISNTQNLAFGSYTFDLQATDGMDVQTQSLTLNVQDPNADPGDCNILVSTDVPINTIINGTISSTINVSDFGSVTDINVRMEGDHTRVRDLTFELQSPSGTKIKLININDPCNGSGDNFNLGFDDESSLTIAGDLPCPPIDGRDYQPEQDLSTFDTEEVNGTWTLFVTDIRIQVGTLHSWSLEYCALDDDNTGSVDCLTHLIIDDNPIAAATYQASVGIESAGKVTSGTVLFEAGEYVQLNPGFEANAGTNFTARIAPCTNTVKDDDNSALVEKRSEEMNTKTNRLNVFPNPLHDQTTIELDLAVDSWLTIELYDLTGKRVRTLVNEARQTAGTHPQTLDASTLENGMYILLVRINDEVKAQKISIIR